MHARFRPAGIRASSASTRRANDKPPLDYRTEVFQLNPQLTDAAVALSRNVVLADSAQAQAARAKFNYAPANRPPAVIQCDTSSGNTWFSGTLIGERARQWTKILTDGKGTYCMTAQEDNATYEALKRAASVKRSTCRASRCCARVGFRPAVCGTDECRQPAELRGWGGFAPATENLYRAGNPLVQDIVTHWGEWRDGCRAGKCRTTTQPRSMRVRGRTKRRPYRRGVVPVIERRRELIVHHVLLQLTI